MSERFGMKSLVAILFLLAGTGCEVVRIVGDSVAAGVCADDPCVGFVQKMQNELAHHGYIVTNHAVPGTAMVQAGCGDDYYAENIAPFVSGAHIHVAGLGLNDVLYGVSVPTFRLCLDLLVQKLLDDGALSVVVSPTNPMPNHPSQITKAQLEQFRQEVIARCDGGSPLPCSLGPDAHDFMQSQHYNPNDNAHPNQLGHDALADAYANHWQL